jgi:cytochrome c oxidase cbb3-type subunit 1
MIGINRSGSILFKSALIWFFLSCFFQQLRSVELIFPRFAASWLTFGRVDAAAEASFLYGWGCCSAFAAGLRICAVPPLHGAALLTFFWNLATAIGVILILAGKVILMPVFPSSLNFFLLLIALFFCFPILRACWQSEQCPAISQRWLVAGVFFLPWLLFTAATLLGEGVLRGAARLPIEAWFHEGFLWLWLGGIALGFAYFLVAKVLKAPLVEQGIAPAGFWIFYCVGFWATLRTISGGAVPAWVSAAGTSANLLLWIPIVVIWKNICATLKRFSLSLKSNPALRFTVLGTHVFILCAIQGIVLYSKTGAAFLQFTDFTTSQALLTRYGFLSSIFCGASYYFLPRLLLREWPLAHAIFWHFHLHRAGLAIAVLSLAIGGVVQGILLNNPILPFSASVQAAFPWRCLASIGWGLFFLAQMIFIYHCLRLFRVSDS